MVKIMMIGIDGASWAVIDPLIERGQLPNLARLRQQGASGTLRAFAHLLTSAALWTTINSGKTEAKHGVSFFGTTARDVRCKRIWDILGEQGWRVGVCGELITWPPVPVNGFLIPDLFALGPETYPPTLQFLQELALGEKDGGLAARRGSYPWQMVRHGVGATTLMRGAAVVARRRLKRHEPYLDWFWRKALLQPRIYTDVVLRLCRQYQPDYLSFHFHTTDTISHRYWKYWQPQSFSRVDAAEVARYADVIPTAYREADRTVGALLRLADKETTVIVLSDHGFAAVPDAHYQHTLKLDTLMRLLGLENGAAVPARLGSTHILYLRDVSQRDHVRAALDGVRVEGSPRPLFRVREGQEFVSFLIDDRSEDLRDRTITAPFGHFQFDDLFEDRGFVDSGEHHPEGIVMLAGNGIRQGVQLAERSVLDVTPTILALAGLPVPADMDGTVIEEALSLEFVQRHPIRICDTYEADATITVGTGLSDSEDEAVLERLRALGYL